MDAKTKETIEKAARACAAYVRKHPMLTTILDSTMVKWQVPLTTETRALMLEETVRALNSMVNG